MDLTIAQALERGVTAHKEGKLQEAEKLYRAILQSQPQHPDANHNLGVLAVGVGKVEGAIPHFKAALAANAKMEQYWLSYIDALIKLNQMDTAKAVLEQARAQGVWDERFDNLAVKQDEMAKDKERELNEGLQTQCSKLLEYYKNRRYADAEELAFSISQKLPNNPFPWKVAR